jgi:hypothetical protein
LINLKIKKLERSVKIILIRRKRIKQREIKDKKEYNKKRLHSKV